MHDREVDLRYRHEPLTRVSPNALGHRGPLGPRRIGNAAERVVCDYLVAKGFAIVARNARFGSLEVDILARRGPLVALVEVRARGPGSWLGPFASLTLSKRRNLRRAATQAWRLFANDSTVERLRIDVAAVDLWSTPVTVEIAEAVDLEQSPVGFGTARSAGESRKRAQAR